MHIAKRFPRLSLPPAAWAVLWCACQLLPESILTTRSAAVVTANRHAAFALATGPLVGCYLCQFRESHTWSFRNEKNRLDQRNSESLQRVATDTVRSRFTRMRITAKPGHATPRQFAMYSQAPCMTEQIAAPQDRICGCAQKNSPVMVVGIVGLFRSNSLDQFCVASQSSNTFTISDNSQRVLVTSAAIAGVQRRVWCIRT